MTPDLRRLLLDVILLDGEQDAAPSLGDMARRAQAILDAEAKGTEAGAITVEHIKATMLAGFRSGWAAAWVTVAQAFEGHGDKEPAAWARGMANKPPEVEAVDGSTPEGRAIVDKSEAIYVERFSAGKPRGTP